MCMQVGAIKVFIQQSALLPALIIILLAPGCPKDNVSIDEHLLIHNTDGHVLLKILSNFLLLFLYLSTCYLHLLIIHFGQIYYQC